MSPTAAPLWLLLFYLIDVVDGNQIYTATTKMKMKCGDSMIPGSYDGPPTPGPKFSVWPNNEICGQEPKDASYMVCNNCNSDCLKKISSKHLIISTSNKKDLGDLPANIAFFQYTDSGSGIVGSCFVLDEDKMNTMEGTGNDALRSFSKTSVLFVSISFIILMVISLAWLVFYYVQRFRYAHAKDRLQRRLFNAARKALTRIQTRTLRAGEAILDTDCAVCIDPYQIADVVRELPCKHVYHKSCIDPWLLEHRTCPMCKADIVKHFGYHLTGNEGSRLEEGGTRDAESPEPPSSGSESAAFPYQGGPADLEFHYAPTTSPQLVMSSSTAKSFAIVPLTVHSKTLPVTVNTPAEVEQAGPSNRTEKIVSGGQIGHSSARPASQGQIVNLIQVRARAQSCTRAVPLRRAERPGSTRPAPVDTNHVV